MTLRNVLLGSRDTRWLEADPWWRDEAGDFKTPAQKCPRGCSEEIARREVITRSTWFGRVEVRVRFHFEARNCFRCGSPLLSQCQRCDAKVVAPIRDRCESCGLPQPWSPERLSAARRMRPRRWKSDAHAPAERLFEDPEKRGQLLVFEGDISNIEIDTIVSNDDVDGQMYTVIASAIRDRSGTDVEDQSMAHGPFPPGQAWFTDAGLMTWIDGIVHVASMDRNGNIDITIVKRCLEAALEETVRQGFRSVAVAAFGTSLPNPRKKGVTLDEWLRALAEVAVPFIKRQPAPSIAPDEAVEVRTEDVGLSVLAVLYEPKDYNKLRNILKKAADKAAART